MTLAELEQAELGELAAGAVRAIVAAQQSLDEEARRRAEIYLEAPAGSLALPPLWYGFESVVLELQVSAAVAGPRPGSDRDLPRLLCRTANPTTVALYGYQAAAGLTVRFAVTPNGPIPAKPPSPEAPL